MAICKFCNEDMLKTEGCRPIKIKIWSVSAHRKNERSRRLLRNMEPVKYGSETRFAASALPRCPDCNVVVGNYHHPNCDWEECPNCHMQMLMCGGECGDFTSSFCIICRKEIETGQSVKRIPLGVIHDNWPSDESCFKRLWNVAMTLKQQGMLSRKRKPQ